MAGIFGIHDPHGRLPKKRLESLLAGMKREFDEPAWHLSSHVSDGLAVSVASYREEGPVQPAAQAGDLLLASAGSFILADDRPAAGWTRAEINRALLDLAAHDSHQVFEQKLEGRFAIVLLDRRTGTLRLGSDRFALYPLYVFARDGILWFSTRLAAIARPNLDVLTYDTDSIADYLAHKHFIGNTTYFREIEVLPEGSYVTFAGGRLDTHRYWQHRLEEDPARSLHGREADERLREAWNRSMDAAARAGRLNGVPLSGGLDSRALIASLAHRGKDTIAYTFGDPNCNDIRFARQVTDILRIPHVTTTLDNASFICREAGRIITRSDGSLPLNHGHPIALAPFISGTCDTLYDGLTGEVLGAVGLNRHRKTRVTPDTALPMLAKHFILHGDEVIRRIVPGATPAPERLARYGYYYSDFGGHTWGGSAVNLFSNTSRQRRFITHQPRLLEGEKRTFCPFWTIDYADVCASLTPADRRLMRPWVMLNRTEFPELLSVPWTRTGVPISVPVRMAEWLVWIHHPASYVNYYAKKYAGLSPLGSYQSGFAFYFDWYRDNPRLRSFIEQTLHDPSVARIPFLDHKAVSKAVTDHMSNILVNNSDLIGTLLAIVLYLDHLQTTP